MYQRHSFGAPPPIFTPPPNPFKQTHYATDVGPKKDPLPGPKKDPLPGPKKDPLPNWSQPMKAVLDKPPMQQDDGFPSQLSLLQQDKPQPVPAIDFSATTGQSVADLFNKEMKIYVTPTDYFTTKFQKIFKTPKSKITTSKYARPWIKGPNMGFWQQQLNFAVWCATTGCGVSREMLFPNSSLKLSEQIRTFYQFHVYYTTRKILYEMGGI